MKHKEALETHGLEAKVNHSMVSCWRGEFGPSIKVMIYPENKQGFAPRLQ